MSGHIFSCGNWEALPAAGASGDLGPDTLPSTGPAPAAKLAPGAPHVDSARVRDPFYKNLTTHGNNETLLVTHRALNMSLSLWCPPPPSVNGAQ